MTTDNDIIVQSQFTEEIMYTFDMPPGELPSDFLDTLSTLEGFGWSTIMLTETSSNPFMIEEPKESFGEEKPPAYKITFGLQIFEHDGKTIPPLIPQIKDVIKMLPEGTKLRTYNKKKCENIYRLQRLYNITKFTGLSTNVGF